MATLKNVKNDQLIILRPQHIFGRHAAGSHTILNNPEASRLHASVYWNGSNWLIKDTSSNGTYLNGTLITSGIKKRLNIGDIIQFGALQADQWVLNDINPPKSLLISLFDNGDTIELNDVILLPDYDEPEVTVYQSANGHWLSENQSGVQILETGSKVLTKDQSWIFIDAESVEKTHQAVHSQGKGAGDIQLKFIVSKNEEHVSLVISMDHLHIDLAERTHHYLILMLARKRLSDNQIGVEKNEQGWFDKDLLCQQLGLDERYINLQIYRFRKQLIQANPIGMQLLQLIERRRGELRLATDAIEIIGGLSQVKNE